IDLRSGCHHPQRLAHSGQTQRLPRRPESHLYFRAHLDPFHEGSERVAQEGIALVAAVESDLLAQEARRDANPDRRRIRGRREAHRLTAVIMISTRPSGAKRPDATVARAGKPSLKKAR